jgi:signal transduction histidine kinase
MGPLQVISNATYLLRHNPEEVEDMAKIIDNNVDYSVKILDDLRTVTKHRELVKSQVDLAELIDQSLAGNVRQQSVKVERAYTGPVNINADSTSIRRCIDNLIKNAVEAMPQGGERLILRITLLNSLLRIRGKAFQLRAGSSLK